MLSLPRAPEEHRHRQIGPAEIPSLTRPLMSARFRREAEAKAGDDIGRPTKSARNRGAARGHAQLGYAGGSWRSPEPANIGDREAPRTCTWKSMTCNFRNRDRIRAGQDANHKRHVPARLFHMIGECVVIINRMLMYYSVGMLMGDEMAVVPTLRVAESKAKIVVTGIAGCRFRCCDKYALECKRDRRRQHHRDSHMLQRSSSSGPQKSASSSMFIETWYRGAYVVASTEQSQQSGNLAVRMVHIGTCGCVCRIGSCS